MLELLGKAVVLSVAIALLLTSPCVDTGSSGSNKRTTDPSSADSPSSTAGTASAPANPAPRSPEGSSLAGFEEVAVAGTTSDAESESHGGFDIRLVRVQPGPHVGSNKLCDISFAGRPSAIEGREVRRYQRNATHRMSVKCWAPTGAGWADLVFDRPTVPSTHHINRGTRIRVEIISPDGGFAEYPIVKFIEIVGKSPVPSKNNALFTIVDPAFDFRYLRHNNGLVGSSQTCGVAFAGSIDRIEDSIRRRRNYPSTAQNRMILKCKHAQGEEWVDLIFTVQTSMSALAIRRGVQVVVEVISKDGGFADYPVVRLTPSSEISGSADG